MSLSGIGRCNTGGFWVSRTVIRDVVVPIISKIMREEGYFSPYRHLRLEDTHLEEFMEEALRKRFGVIGANDCQHLKEQLEEANKNDPYSLEFLVKRLLKKYVKLSTKIRYAKRIKKVSKGPPDRFSRLRTSRYNPYCSQT